MHPSTQIIETVIRESRLGGRTQTYLTSQASWEKTMRNNFESVKVGLNDDVPTARQQAEILFRDLNRDYRTRYPLAHIDRALGIIVDFVAAEGWWKNSPPPLLSNCLEDLSALAALIPPVLNRIAEDGSPRPCSLLTKFLHFCFPDTFPICDAQAAASIQMWSYVAFNDRGEVWSQFTSGSLANTSGSGYGGILRFYQILWEAASADHRTALETLADENTTLMGAHVSVLDLVDKLLWLADGDPLGLGFRWQ